MSSPHNLMTAADFLRVVAKNKGSLPSHRGGITVQDTVHLRAKDLGEEVEGLYLENCNFMEGIFVSEFPKLKSLRVDSCSFLKSGLDVRECKLQNLSVTSGGKVSRISICYCEAKSVWLSNLQIERELEVSACKIGSDLTLAGCTFGEFVLQNSHGGPSVIAGVTIDDTYREEGYRADEAHQEKLFECAAVAATQLRFMNVPTRISSALARRLVWPQAAQARAKMAA